MKKSRERMKGFVIGFVVAMVLSSSIALMAGTGVMREVFFGVSVMVNGEPLELEEDMQAFIMGGRTFLPARIVEQIADMPVNWNDETWTVYIGRRPVEEEALLGRWQVMTIEEIWRGQHQSMEYDNIFLEFFADGTLVASEYGRPDETQHWTLQAGRLHFESDWEDVVMDVEIIDDTLILLFDDWGATITITLTRIE